LFSRAVVQHNWLWRKSFVEKLHSIRISKTLRQISALLEEAARSILREIKNLPGTVTDPHWLKSLEEDKS
jgi:hypothetical protein